MKKAHFVLPLFLIVSFIGSTQNDSLITAACIAKIDSTYKALVEKNKVVGTSIALIKDGQIIYTTGYGFQDKEQLIQATENTPYRIGSCTKSFTALSLLQLQEQGKLNLSDPIQKYLPELQIESRFDPNNPIIISDILSHTSGLPDDILNGFFCDEPPSIDWLIEQLNYCTMSSPANYHHSYSNVGYGILGKLITRVSGEEYGAYLKDHIFTPLEMKDSYLDDTLAPSRAASRGYVKGKLIEEVQIRDQAAGLVASTASDMARYVNLFLSDGATPNGAIISSGSLHAMEQNYTGTNTLPTSLEWGYGLYAQDLNFATESDTISVRMIGHGGDTWAFHSDFQFIPELNIGAVVLTNSDTGGGIRNAKRLLTIYLKEMEGKTQVTIKDEQPEPDPRDQACNRTEVLGTYYFSGIRMEVKDPAKIKMKQGSHSIVFKEVNDSLYYKGKVRLFSLIPIKIKHQEFKFVKLNDVVYLKVIMTASRNEEYASVKSSSMAITPAWEKMQGKYTPVNKVYSCTDCPFLNLKGIELELKEKKGSLYIELSSDDKSANSRLWLELISDQVAVTPGIGRNTGETVRILENGNLFYSGLEFKLN